MERVGFERRIFKISEKKLRVQLKLYSRRLFNEGSEEILETVRKKKRGVGFVEIENARKMRNKNEALQQIRRGFPWKLSAIFLKNIGNSTQGFQ